MATIQISDIGDEVISELKARAIANNRSLEDEIQFILTEAVSRRIRLERFREFAKRVLESTASSQRTDSVDLLREDRDR